MGAAERQAAWKTWFEHIMRTDRCHIRRRTTKGTKQDVTAGHNKRGLKKAFTQAEDSQGDKVEKWGCTAWIKRNLGKQHEIRDDPAVRRDKCQGKKMIRESYLSMLANTGHHSYEKRSSLSPRPIPTYWLSAYEIQGYDTWIHSQKSWIQSYLLQSSSSDKSNDAQQPLKVSSDWNACQQMGTTVHHNIHGTV